MTTKKYLLWVIALIGLVSLSNAQKYKPAKIMKTKNMVSIPKLINEKIAGAPILSQPIHIQGAINEIITEKHGYAYPALYDWNRDGKKDLLIGEFQTGKKGSYLQVHLNIGTNKKPKYTGKFEYAKDIEGNIITENYWCCIGLHPRFVDLTGDGILDLVTGSYNPGIITLWEGTKNGFKPKVEVEQEGNPRKYINGLPFNDNRSLNYWNYTSVSFADFNKDGLIDLFVSGSGGIRVALNIGTKTKPKFGKRTLLLDPDGEPLYLIDKATIFEHAKEYKGPLSGDMKSYVEPYDWDGDGVIDLLATSSYSYEGQNPIEFFRGVITPKGIRFEQRKPLFKAKDGRKRPFPGSATQVKVEDFNNDGIPDLLLGLSILSIQDYQMVDSLAWMSLEKLGLPRVGKDLGAGYGDPKRHKQQQTMYKKMYKNHPEKIPSYLRSDLNQQVKDIYSSRHRGYVYVMLGKKNRTKAKVKKYKSAKDFVMPELYKLKTSAKSEKSNGPVKVLIESTDNANMYDTPLVIRVKFKMKDGWYLYADNKHNRDAGYIITDIKFKTSKGILINGKLNTPEVYNPEGTASYRGSELVFEQVFAFSRAYYKAKKREVEVNIKYQTCNKDMCLPPVEIIEKIKLKLNY